MISLLRLHHIAVQTTDLANCVSWYQDFFGGSLNWSTDRFSELTRNRLPGISRVTEIAVGNIRFHVFERDGLRHADGDTEDVRFQHVCLATENPRELRKWRQRWVDLFDSGRYIFLRPEHPTGIVVDDAGIESFYCFDVSGLELEFTYIPGPRHEQ
jgi:catechol 2,3-dioxygenase-like lactoylglutathione lyase family enzyme